LKSFTHSQPNIQALRSDKRFDALVKKQEGEHQHIISSYHKEMQALRDGLNLAMQKFTSLSDRNEKELADFRDQATRHISILRERLGAQERVFSDQKKTIEDLHAQLLSFQALYSSMRDVDKVKQEMDSQVREATNSHLVSLQGLQTEFKSLFTSLKEDLTTFKSNAEKKFCELIDQIEKNFNVTKINREGVLKEIRIYDKSIFIIEKKIENIYTLIERINKRGESCRKPE
jgi:hypothetical protein